MSEISKSELARKLGISKARVSKFISRGMPVLASGKLDEEVVLAWVKTSVAKKVDSGSTGGARLVDIRCRREALQAEILELDLKKRKGELVNAAEIHAEIFKKGRMLRDMILNVPDRMGALLAGETDTIRCIAMLTKELRKILTEFADDTEKEPS